jgi:hypothetical protein
MRIMQLVREGSPPPGLRPPQAELSRKFNQVARARIRRFESDMPSQAVRSPARSICSNQTLGVVGNGAFRRYGCVDPRGHEPSSFRTETVSRPMHPHQIA